MSSLFQIVGGLGRPLILGILILVALGFVSEQPNEGLLGTNGFECRGFTNDPEWNRRLCQYHPVKVWNMSLGEMFPFLSSGRDGGGTLDLSERSTPAS